MTWQTEHCPEEYVPKQKIKNKAKKCEYCEYLSLTGDKDSIML